MKIDKDTIKCYREYYPDCKEMEGRECEYTEQCEILSEKEERFWEEILKEEKEKR